MKNLLATSAVAAITIATTSSQACASGSAYELSGNWYCQPVNAISYTNFGTPGSYNKITSFSEAGCSSVDTDYAGGISPMDEEVSVAPSNALHLKLTCSRISWHFRGPLSLKQFAFYTPGTSSKSKRDTKQSLQGRRHAYKHLHPKEVHIREVPAQVEKRSPCEEVTQIMNGKTVTWMNDYMCDPASSAASDAPDNNVATEPGSAAAQATATPASSSSTPTMNAGAGNWGRQAYYNAENQTAEGLVFLNHNGGQGSGTFDYTHGNSLSYSSPDGTTGASTSQILADTMLADDIEVVVMSSTPCTNGDCGTIRPKTVAYHGFEGAQKLFLMEFQMPLTGKTGWVEDMPAIWTLNAQIPNTLQYGSADCSCWESGCGEWDIFEVLDSGNTRAKSTFHGSPGGGDSNYFVRPTDSTMMAAVVFDGEANAGHIVALPDGTIFDDSIAGDVVAGWVNQVSSQASTAVFKLGS